MISPKGEIVNKNFDKLQYFYKTTVVLTLCAQNGTILPEGDDIMANVNVRIDADVKAKAEADFPDSELHRLPQSICSITR